jgi:hypothetical protein
MVFRITFRIAFTESFSATSSIKIKTKSIKIRLIEKFISDVQNPKTVIYQYS